VPEYIAGTGCQRIYLLELFGSNPLPGGEMKLLPVTGSTDRINLVMFIRFYIQQETLVQKRFARHCPGSSHCLICLYVSSRLLR